MQAIVQDLFGKPDVLELGRSTSQMSATTRCWCGSARRR